MEIITMKAAVVRDFKQGPQYEKKFCRTKR